MNVLKIATLSLTAALALGPGHAFGQQQEEKDHVAVLEIGAAGEWGLGENKTGFGPSVAVEVTPIEHWLEIEAGLTPLMSKGGTEWEADLVFKKLFNCQRTWSSWLASARNGLRPIPSARRRCLISCFGPLRTTDGSWSQATATVLVMDTNKISP